MRAAALLLIAGCCAPRPTPPRDPCVTACGLSATAAFECAEVQAFERRAVVELGRVWSPAAVCGALNGWSLVSMTPREDGCSTGWRESGICVIGFTRINTHTVALLSPWSRQTLGHEFVHVVDFETVGHAGHCEWGRRGIKAALFALTGDRSESTDRGCDAGRDGGL